MLIIVNKEKLKRNFAFTDYNDLLFTIKEAAKDLTNNRDNLTRTQDKSARMISVFLNCLEVRDTEISNTIEKLIELTEED